MEYLITQYEGVADASNAVARHVAESVNSSDAVRWKQKGDAVVKELELHSAGLINGHLICEIDLQEAITVQLS
jgi:predicted metalloenzyme YecM